MKSLTTQAKRNLWDITAFLSFQLKPEGHVELQAFPDPPPPNTVAILAFWEFLSRDPVSLQNLLQNNYKI